MGQEDTVLSALYAVINLMISIIIGFILSKIDVLTPKTRSVVSSVNYYALVPIYGLIYIMQAIDRNKLTELGIILFSSVSSVIVGFIVTLAIVWLLGADVRYKFAYTFVIVYQNIVVMPQMMADSMCAKGGKYETTATCKAALVKPYCALPFIYVNIVYWVTVLPVLQNEKSKSNQIRKAMLVALNYYESVDAWLNDKDFALAKSPEFDAKEIEKLLSKGTAATATPMKMITAPAGAQSVPSTDKNDKDVVLQTDAQLIKDEHKATITVPVNSENARFQDEFYEKRITQEDYEHITARYAEFEEKYLSRKDQEYNKKTIENTVLIPENLMEKPVMDDLCTLDFYKRRILLSPPALWSIIGVILGFIFPFKEWFFEPTRKPLPTFIGTLQTVGGMMSPISLFLLGTYIAQSSVVSKDLYIRWRHIIASNLVRNLIIPLIGLLFTFVFIKGMNSEIYHNNPILLVIQYTYWIVPNGIVLIAVYVVADYFAKEFAVISIYMNILSVPMMAIYLIIYFTIYEN